MQIGDLPYAGSSSTEVQRPSFVCFTNEVCCPYPLCNIQNLGAVPPYAVASNLFAEKSLVTVPYSMIFR